MVKLIFGLLVAFITFPFCASAMQFSEQHLNPAEIRAQLTAINLDGASDIPEYLERIEKIDHLVPAMSGMYKSLGLEVSRLRKKYAGRPDLLAIADIVQHLNEKDMSGFSLLCDEIKLSRQLKTTEPKNQRAFFEEKIVPLHRQQQVIIESEIQIALSAIKNGIPIPRDIVVSLKQRLEAHSLRLSD